MRLCHLNKSINPDILLLMISHDLNNESIKFKFILMEKIVCSDLALILHFNVVFDADDLFCKHVNVNRRQLLRDSMFAPAT